ncbi:hypothetical protein [Microbacterium oxydans]|uniref:hypothetical protein n=1 Tax=Microbacterium oxydans TaxID=82380 RepID=UPI00366DBCE6
MTDDKPTTRAEASAARDEEDTLPAYAEFEVIREPQILPLPAYADFEVIREPQILPLWARRVFYVVGTLAGAGALIVGGYDPELAKNIAGAGAILVASLALANPSR